MAGPGAELAAFDIPAVSGSYALRLWVGDLVTLRAGGLGMVAFPPGTYLYLGSAFGPGGLRARIRHHLTGSGKPHWHIDYLRRYAVVQGGWYCAAPHRLECAWSAGLLKLPGAFNPVSRFGASDCKQGCRAHLAAFGRDFNAGTVEAVLQSALAEQGAGRLARF
jgi:Uri superfamily endonuclease